MVFSSSRYIRNCCSSVNRLYCCSNWTDKKVVTLLLAHAEGMKKQLNPIQTETTKLTTTVDRMKADIEFKKESVQSVIQSIKHTGDVLNQVSDVSHDATAKVMKKANNDPNRQAEVERWTNTAMGIIQRKA